ncbi:MAG: patatin-like phospholipase family protein [Syntrophomonadaceae bacterium]|nr:patatin-like phospholipase family protein [Syntrophomonadaceae bacterium]
MEKCGPKVALVLGAGSARGLAHIGVLQVLTDHHIPFHLIIGCSMGAMIGGLYSCGTDLKMLDKMLQHMDVNTFFDVRIPRYGFIAGKKISSFLKLMTKNKNFEDLDPPVIMVATDLISGQEVQLNSGLVADGIRASISIPGIFHPVKLDEMILVDGAVTNRLPIDIARSLEADITIAVDVTFCEGKQVNINNTLDVILTSLDIMQKQQFDLVCDQADILIQPEVGGFSSREFDNAGKIIQLGREAAEKKIPEIIGQIKKYGEQNTAN